MFKNEAQEEIINFINGQMIVIACPGSGKTTTILRRINRLQQDVGVNPENILMITFTKAAAREMEEKYRDLFEGGSKITFCTIHALCLALLRKFSGRTSEDIVKRPTDYIYPLIRQEEQIRDKKKFLKDALTDISVVKNSRIDVSEYMPNCCTDTEFFKSVYFAYENGLKKDGLIDFDDILILACDMLNNRPNVLSWIRDKYKYIHVDEYQDINNIQKEIIYLLAGKNGNLVVVGDDDQSIYGFRGAKPEIMFRFGVDFPQARDIYMTMNYRSDTEIIKYASSLIRNNPQRFEKEIITKSEKTGMVTYNSCTTLKEELHKLVDDASVCIQAGAGIKDIAILYRTNAQSVPIAEALRSRGIDFYSNEPIESRYESWVFSDICAYFKTALGTGTQKDFDITVTHPSRWLKDIKIKKTGLDTEKMKASVAATTRETWKLEKRLEAVDKYLEFMEILPKLNIRDGLKVLCSMGGYLNYLSGYAAYQNDNAEELFLLIDSFLNDIERWEITTFDEWIAKANAYNNTFQETQKHRTGVCLSTMHKAKGLEWKYVFISSCNEGIIPYRRSSMTDDIEEERRLFYVAMTRAKNELHLYSHEKRNNTPMAVSRFLIEADIVLPEENRNSYSWRDYID